MTLAQYLAQHGLSQAEFARRIRYPEATVSRWVAGRMVPRRLAMREIEAATGGAVTPASWFLDAPASSEASA
jgi:transcriptional regulator with XRE-family HTH domain